MAAIGHHLEDVIALLRQRNTSTLCCPWRYSRVKAERLMVTTGQLFEELMATFHTLGIADPPLELDVLDVPGADRDVRVSRMIIQRLQLLAAHTLRGFPDSAALIGEAESLNELQEFLRERGLPQDQIDLQAWRLNSELSRKISVQVKTKA